MLRLRSGVRQLTTFDGALLRIGGAGDFVPVQMQDLSGDVYSGFSAPKSLAKMIAPLIFEPIRVSGMGSWNRTPAGEWKLMKMLIQAYEPLNQESASDVLKKLQSAPVQWPENTDEMLSAVREAAL